MSAPFQDTLKNYYGAALAVPPALENAALPWDAVRPPLYHFISQKLKEQCPFPKEHIPELPDRPRKEGQIDFGPGVADGLALISFETGYLQEAIEAIYPTLLLASKTLAKGALKDLYTLITQYDALSYSAGLLERIYNHLDDFAESHLYQLALWLVSQAPDREPVKLGMGLVGLFGVEQNDFLFTILGSHEEFTLFAANEFARFEKEDKLFDLAQRCSGWGRILCVRLLARSQNPKILDWLLDGGYENSVDVAYTAYPTIKASHLIERLQKEEIDLALLEHAGVLLEALLRGADYKSIETIEDYPEASLAIDLYLKHAEKKLSPEDVQKKRALFQSH
jgi:hypothetical protein